MKVIRGSFLPQTIPNIRYVMEDAEFFLYNVAIVGSIVRMSIQCPPTSYELSYVLEDVQFSIALLHKATYVISSNSTA